ncbi:MAG TPA: TlpA disulfide reductase family protein [Solirubrobacteraceae bacterium]|jgi:thiol-disulfide isomerase/thioredoxin|nr:TlpA disulfide reductase family protein [Solirubrobacteraceae bacterium]
MAASVRKRITPARAALIAGVVAVAALLAVGLAQLGQSTTPSEPSLRLSAGEMRARLRGSPAALAALHEQANSLLPGGLGSLRARVAALHGRPLVINKWASWCVPCRSEFGAFQRASLALGRRVAFIGIDSGDSSRADALAFLRSYPVSYPSYYDPSGAAGGAVTDSSFTPVTVFLDAVGRQYIHQGPYPSQRKLERDVRRYALGA